MRRFIATALVLGLLIGAVCAAEDDPEPSAGDARKFVGEWEVSEIKIMGMAIPFPNNEKMTFAFAKDGSLKAGGGFGGQGKAGKWKIDPKKAPKHLDLTDNNNTTPMIYKLEKDVLTIAGAAGNGGERPKDFASAPAMMVLKRKAKK